MHCFVHYGGRIYSIYHCSLGGVWLKIFLQHLGVVTVPLPPMTIFCDNQSVLMYTKDPKYYSKTKLIDIKYNFIIDIV